MDRIILHCDCNSFYASVEMVKDPSLKNVPMAVCGNVDDRHGIVLAKNELAKKFGISTAETVHSAKKKCPGLVIVPPRHKDYLKYSAMINRIYLRYTDLVEPFGIDESWLDITGSAAIFGGGYNTALEISNAVKREIGITLSIGVSFNKVYAKLGSDYRKPDAITVIDRSNYKKIVYPLDVSALLFVGKKTADKLKECGIHTIGELASAGREFLVGIFGKNGEMLLSYADGSDMSPVIPEEISGERKSVSQGYTFSRDLTGPDEYRVAIEYLSDKIAHVLRNEELLCSTVSVNVKNSALRDVTRQRSLSAPTSLSKEISEAAYSLMLSFWASDEPVRSITVGTSNLIKASTAFEQLDFFGSLDDGRRDKINDKERSVDIIRKKFGESAMFRGSEMNNDFGIRTNKNKGR